MAFKLLIEGKSVTSIINLMQYYVQTTAIYLCLSVCLPLGL